MKMRWTCFVLALLMVLGGCAQKTPIAQEPETKPEQLQIHEDLMILLELDEEANAMLNEFQMKRLQAQQQYEKDGDARALIDTVSDEWQLFQTYLQEHISALLENEDASSDRFWDLKYVQGESMGIGVMAAAYGYYNQLSTGVFEKEESIFVEEILDAADEAIAFLCEEGLNIKDTQSGDAEPESVTVEKWEKFTIHLPEIWEGVVTQKQFETDTVYGITVNHKPSEDAGCGGTLFSVQLQPVTEPYNPDHGFECWGTLTDPEGNVENIIVYRPTDVQFSETTVTAYKALKGQIPQVLEMITFADGYTFEKK